MRYTDGEITGTFGQLWPDVSTFDQAGFAVRRGFSAVSSVRMHDPMVQQLVRCDVYVDEADGCYYDVRAEPLDLLAIKSNVETAIKARLDAFARSRGYDHILSACTYPSSKVGRFAAEAQLAIDLRDATWDVCYAVLGQVESGARPLPTMAQLLAELPVLEWPDMGGEGAL